MEWLMEPVPASPPRWFVILLVIYLAGELFRVLYDIWKYLTQAPKGRGE